MRNIIRSDAVFRSLAYWIALQFLVTCYARSLCSFLGHRSAIVDNRLFFTSGIYYFDDGEDWENTPSLYWLPLNSTIDNSGFIDLSLLGSISLPSVELMDNTPHYSGETFFYDQTSLYPYGVSNVSVDSWINNTGWVYNVTEVRWDLVQSQGDNFSFTNNSKGVYASDPTTGASFYVGGLLNRTVIFQSSNSVPTVATGAQGPNVVDGAMVYVRKGLSGVLLVLGGYKSNSTGDYQRSFSNISIYDISSDTWYTQTASGDIPGLRSRFCAGVSAAPDDSSFQVTIHGGIDIDQLQSLNDVYVLSIPSFQWIKINDSNNPDLLHADWLGRSEHKCDVWNEGQLIVSGGIVTDVTLNNTVKVTHFFNAGCNREIPPFKVLDTSTYTWRKSLDPNLEYAVPDSVTAVIGGTLSGGATAQAPSAGWDFENLGSIFSKTVPKDAAVPANTTSNTTSNTPSNTPPHTATPVSGNLTGGLSKGAMTGIVIAAVIAAIALAGGALIWLSKRYRVIPRKLVETVKILATPDDHWHKPELEASANARYEIGISEPRPHELHEEGVTKSELPGSFPPLVELP